MPNPLIFVVDDEMVIASTLALILRRQGFVTLSFSNPLEALDMARLESPDLLLTDVMMPQLSGIDLALRILEFCPDCKVLLFSGQAASADMLKDAKKKGHNFNILSKPIHPGDLVRSIQTLADSPAKSTV